MSAVDFFANEFHFIAKRWEQEKDAKAWEQENQQLDL